MLGQESAVLSIGVLAKAGNNHPEGSNSGTQLLKIWEKKQPICACGDSRSFIIWEKSWLNLTFHALV